MDALVELPGDRLVLGGGKMLLRRPTDRRGVAQGRAGARLRVECLRPHQAVHPIPRRRRGTRLRLANEKGHLAPQVERWTAKRLTVVRVPKATLPGWREGKFSTPPTSMSDVTVPSSETFCHINK